MITEERLRHLESLSIDIERPTDFDAFWHETKELAKESCEYHLKKVSYPLKADCYRISYPGFAGTEIRGWYLIPKGVSKAPVMVNFHGYRMDAGTPERYASWLLNGFAVLAMDIRGQLGETGDAPYSWGAIPGWVTGDILDPYSCYYRRVIVDGLRLVDLTGVLPEVDPNRVLVYGGSQGGGLALALAALHKAVSLTVAAVPNMCHFEYGIHYSSSSLKEVAEYLRLYPQRSSQVFRTLSYFDNLNLAPWIQSPILVSVGLKDPICLPETIYAAYNKIQAPKRIIPYPFSGHDGGGEIFSQEALEFAFALGVSWE